MLSVDQCNNISILHLLNTTQYYWLLSLFSLKSSIIPWPGKVSSHSVSQYSKYLLLKSFILQFRYFSGITTVWKAEYSQGRPELCQLQVRTFTSKGLANDVRFGQNVPALSQLLENGDSLVKKANNVHWRDCYVQGKAKVTMIGP